MRPISADADAILTGSPVVKIRLSVDDGTSTLRDLTTYPGMDLLEQLSWGETLDDAGLTWSADVTREQELVSVAPYVEASPLNHAFDPTTDAKPLIKEGRRVKAEYAMQAEDDPRALSWQLAWEGYIDSPDSAAGDTVKLAGRGLEAAIQDCFIEKERIYAFCQGTYATKGASIWPDPTTGATYTTFAVGDLVLPTDAKTNGHFYRAQSITTGITGATEPNWDPGSGATVVDGGVTWIESGVTSIVTGTDVEVVMQQILNDNMGAGAPTLWTPTSPSWEIQNFNITRQSTWEELKALADEIGWCIRYVVDSGVSKLKFFDPNRDTTTSLRTFAASEFESPTKLATNIADRRNAIRVVYSDSQDRDPNGDAKRKALVFEDATSITEIGRRFGEFAEDSTGNIDTSTEATALGARALSDMSQPQAEMDLVLRCFFFAVEMCDLYSFEADGIRFDSTQKLAVSAYGHSVANGVPSTKLTLRGKPASNGSKGWLQRMSDAVGAEVHQLTSMQNVDPFVMTIDTSVVGGARFNFPWRGAKSKKDTEYELHLSTTSGFTADASTLVHRGPDRFVEPANLDPATTYYGQLLPVILNGKKPVRGQPSEEFSFVPGRAQATHLDPNVEWGRLPLNGGFETQFNLARPPDFWFMEGGFFGTWGVNGFVLSDGFGVSGSQYVRLISSTLTVGARINSAEFSVNDQISYSPSVWRKTISGGGTCTIRIAFFDQNHGNISSQDETFLMSDQVGTWVQHDMVPFTPPPGARFAIFSIWVPSGTSPHQELHIDDARFATTDSVGAPATSTLQGVVSTSAQDLGAGLKRFTDGLAIPNKTQAVSAAGYSQFRTFDDAAQVSEDTDIYRRIVHPEVNVLDFGADPTGVADSTQAFLDAINYFSATNDSEAGTIIVPSGDYRFGSVVRIKKSVRIRGSQGNTPFTGTRIKPDPGVEAFIFDQANTPVIPDLGTGNGSGAALEGFTIQPSGKAAGWAATTAVVAGDVRRCGTGRGADWYRHYVCTTPGTTGSVGPLSVGRELGADKLLSYKTQTVNFAVGEVVTDGTAVGTIILDTDAGTTGQLRLTSTFGTFTDNAALTGSLGGAAVCDGASSDATDFELDGSARWQYIGTGAAVVYLANGCTMRDIFIQGMSGNGVHIESPSVEAVNLFTNANGWHLSNVSIWDCDGHGLYVNGGDVNGGSWVHGTAYGNGAPTTDEAFSGTGYNIYESSFLGNQYWSIQMGSAGLGSVFSDAVSGGNTFVGCYQEGTGGGENFFNPNTLVVGGSLASAQSRTSNGTILGTNFNSRMGFGVPGYTANPWRVSAPMIVGVWRTNAGNVYQCVGVTGDRLTASSGGPTGTGAGITDNHVTWDFVHAITQNGYVDFGGVDPATSVFAAHTMPDAVDGLAAFNLGYGAFTGDTRKAFGLTYGGFSGVGGESGGGLLHAGPATTIRGGTTPKKIPSGRPIVERIWIGDCGVQYGTAEPTVGTYDPGDRLYYKGSACVAGGVEGRVCVTAGTAGTYTGGRTGTTDGSGSGSIVLSGAAMSPYPDQQEFKVGDILTIDPTGTPQTSRVLRVSADGLTLFMVDVMAPLTNKALIFVNPVWKDFGSIAA